MENVLTPMIGSNQFIKKFGKVKSKTSLKLKFKTKVKIATIALLAASLYSNWILLRANYVFRCSEGGMFMSQSKCNELAENKFAAQELSRQEFLTINQDILQ